MNRKFISAAVAASVVAVPVVGVAAANASGTSAASATVATATTSTSTKATPAATKRSSLRSVGVTAKSPYKFGTKKYSKWYAREYMKNKYGWGAGQYKSVVKIFDHESGWSSRSMNRSSGAYGIPQSLPGAKMKSAGKDWRTNPETQIRWGLKYMHDRYGTPNKTWAFWQSHNWY